MLFGVRSIGIGSLLPVGGMEIFIMGGKGDFLHIFYFRRVLIVSDGESVNGVSDK